MFEKITYKDVAFFRCEIDYNRQFCFRPEHCMPSRYRGKDAYFSRIGENFYDKLDRPVYSFMVKPNHDQTLFVSKESKMPRALLRGSDYKITIDKNKADFVVVPHPGEIIERKVNLVVATDDIIHCVKFIKKYGCPKIDEELVESIKKAFERRYTLLSSSKVFVSDSPDQCRLVYFVKKCTEYESMLDSMNEKRYCYDERCRFTPTTEINPENLEFLVRCKDGNIFEKMVLGSDWQEYPLTVCAVIYMNMHYHPGEKLKLVTNAIHYQDYINDKYDYVISAKDWNMFQQWLMFHYGLDDQKGGFLTVDVYKDFSKKCRKDTSARVAVKPVFIEQPTSYQAIRKML